MTRVRLTRARLIGIGAALAAVIAAGAAFAGGLPGGTAPTTVQGSPSQTHTYAPGVPTPRSTPTGTPGPTPAEVTVSSAEISPPPTPANATPTPGPEAGLWRLQGYVVDEDGKPLENVCVVVGPHGCQTFSPHTDASGHWFLDVAEGVATFDFYFEMPGYQTVWWEVTPKGSQEFNAVLKRS